jgi:hypothetical protein
MFKLNYVGKVTVKTHDKKDKSRYKFTCEFWQWVPFNPTLLHLHLRSVSHHGKLQNFVFGVMKTMHVYQQQHQRSAQVQHQTICFVLNWHHIMYWELLKKYTEFTY